MATDVECIVVGAGVVGLAVARALAQAGREVLVLESADNVGTATSARSSEVIHAGIYYPKGSLKAALCVRGRRLLYNYCAEKKIPHKQIGKLIVACNEQEVPALHDLHARAVANGVSGLEFLNPGEARRKEPALQCSGALYSPATGILDSHALIQALRTDAEAAGATIVLHTPFRGARASGVFEINAGIGSNAAELRSKVLINAAGLNAQSVANRITRMQERLVPERHLYKGSYFSLSGRPPFQRLIYPVPGEGLGIHFTVDMAQRARFGPDSEPVAKVDYAVDPARAEAFYTAVRRYYPDLADGALQPAYAGIRPRLNRPGAPPGDFVIQGRGVHGIRGLVNLFGLESPALTAVLAIADEVVVAAKE